MPPNVIVIMTDQQRADHRAAEDFELDTMPALDRWEAQACSFPVAYTTDHGDFVGDYGLWSKGVGLPECLARVPMIWQGPGVVSAAPRAHVSLVDIFPTICEALKLEIPEGVQGRSLWPILQGEGWPEAEFGSIYAERAFCQ